MKPMKSFCNRSSLALMVCVLTALNASAETPPQYGGTLNIGTIYVTLTPLSWDPADWAWKSNHDAGMVREQLFSGDLDKSTRKGGAYPFIAEAYLPADSMRGELAESWHWEDPLTLVVKLRQGIMFTGRPGVMEDREFVAEDVAYTYNVVDQSPKRIPTYFDHIDAVVARDRYTVVFHFGEYNAEWAYRFGYGYYSSIVPQEMADVDPKDWRNVTGTGPFFLERYIQGNAQIYAKNPRYWDRENLGGEVFPIPFVDKVIYRVIKDEATFLTALRTGQLDILESIRWIAVDHLKATTPELQWNRWLSMRGSFMALRVDREPFDDLKVRRALNLAINQREIVERYYGGHAELMAYPQHPDFGPYYQPLEEMPDSIQELFEYKPERARELLAEAGYSDGFEFDVQVCSCNPDQMDLIDLVESYLAKVGVTIRIQPMEYASFLSTMTTRTHGPGYFLYSGHVNPTTTLRKSFLTGQTWNPSMYANPVVDEKIREMHLTREESKRVEIIRALTIQMLDEAPYIWLPTPYLHTAWWPWVKNYGGELRAGAVRPGPIYARIWIDQSLKKKMGF